MLGLYAGANTGVAGVAPKRLCGKFPHSGCFAGRSTRTYRRSPFGQSAIRFVLHVKQFLDDLVLREIRVCAVAPREMARSRPSSHSGAAAARTLGDDPLPVGAFGALTAPRQPVRLLRSKQAHSSRGLTSATMDAPKNGGAGTSAEPTSPRAILPDAASTASAFASLMRNAAASTRARLANCLRANETTASPTSGYRHPSQARRSVIASSDLGRLYTVTPSRLSPAEVAVQRA